MRRFLTILTIVSLCMALAPVSIFAGELQEHKDIGYYDVWRYSDGVTWQNGEEPGDAVEFSHTITIPCDDSKNPTNFSVEYLEEDTGYKEFSVKKENSTITDFEYLGNGQLSYTMATKLLSYNAKGQLGRVITQTDWQAKLVKGYRYYTPILVTWEYEQGAGTQGIAQIQNYGRGVMYSVHKVYDTSGAETVYYSVANTKTNEKFEFTDESSMWDKIKEEFDKNK